MDTSFTSENKAILGHCNLQNKTLINKSANGVRVNISWTQVMRSAFGNAENYKECDFEIEGKPGSIVKVFVAESCGPPPKSFCTSGHKQGGGVLHFGFVFTDDETGKAVFFVIHPNSWGPYQHRFRTSGLTKLLNTGVGKGAGIAASAAAGAVMGSVFPGVGTAIGGAVGAGVGWIATTITPSYAGQYCRYIGA